METVKTILLGILLVISTVVSLKTLANLIYFKDLVDKDDFSISIWLTGFLWGLFFIIYNI